MPFLTLTGQHSITKLSSLISVDKSSCSEMVDIWNDSKDYFLTRLDRSASEEEAVPASGMILNGNFYPIQLIAKSNLYATPTTKGNQLCPSMQKWSSCAALWQTPTASDYKKGQVTHKEEEEETYPTPNLRDTRLGCHQKQLARHILTDGEKRISTGQLNPDWVEWLMGFPLQWTKIIYDGEKIKY